MTAVTLLAYIVTAILLQVAAGVVIVARRHRSAGARTPVATQDEARPRSADAWSGWRDFRVALRDFEDGKGTQCSFYLKPIDGKPLPPFRPGQFLTFSLDVVSTNNVDGNPVREITRCYSLSDMPTPECYRVTIKRVGAPDGRPELPPGASSTHFHERVREGDVLKVKAPSGHFYLDPAPEVSAVLIAGGIGITPMMSMLRWCLSEQPERVVHLYYGLRNSDEHAFKPQLDRLAGSSNRFHLNTVYSRPGPEDVLGSDYHHAGHVDIDLLRRTLPHGRHQFYVCGPSAMMESLVPAILNWGVPQEDLRYEAFGPASVRAARLPMDTPGPALTNAVDVHFRRSGRALSWDGRDESLLEFAERHGVSVDSGCRSGGCGACETKLISGAVEYAHEPDHDVAPGHCLLCVGIPSSDVELEA